MAIRFEILSHTADKGIKIFGANYFELFENAAYGMFSLMADISHLTPVISFDVHVGAADRELLLREWLSELIYLAESEQILIVEFKIIAVSEIHLNAIVKGITYSPDIEWIGSPIKAVTYHDLYIRKVDDIYEAQVIFDV